MLHFWEKSTWKWQFFEDHFLKNLSFDFHEIQNLSSYGSIFWPPKSSDWLSDLFGQRKKFCQKNFKNHKISSCDQISLKASLSSWGVKIWTHGSLSFEFDENQKTGFWENGLQKIPVFRWIFLKNEASLGPKKFFLHFGINIRLFVPQNSKKNTKTSLTYSLKTLKNVIFSIILSSLHFETP